MTVLPERVGDVSRVLKETGMAFAFLGEVLEGSGCARSPQR